MSGKYDIPANVKFPYSITLDEEGNRATYFETPILNSYVIEYTDKNGDWHNLKGAAVVYEDDNYKSFYIHGQRIEEIDGNDPDCELKFQKYVKLRAFL